MDFKFKFFALFFSYSLFIVVIIISLNAVVPEDELPVLEQKKEMIKKVDNNFSRNRNSVYDILEDNNHHPKNKSKIEEKKKNKKTNDKLFRLQFASFKEKQKSLEISKELKEKLIKDTIKINMIVKKVNLKNNQIFFRVLSENYYSYNEANDFCKKLEDIKVRCIIIKDEL